jgi:TFIIF-interacting CTD phosphatase-like protein
MKSGSYVKDLAKLGRDLAKIIIVDNVQSNFQMQPENGISIKTWVGDPNDNELKIMAKMLKGKE